MAITHATIATAADDPTKEINKDDWNQAHVGTIALTTGVTGILPVANGGTGLAALPGCRVYNSTALSIANVTVVALTFDSERYDVGGLHSTSTNTGRITIVTAGKYLVSAAVRWATFAGNTVRAVSIQLNGTTVIGEDVSFSAGESGTCIATVYALAAADYLEVVVYQDTGGALNVAASPAGSPEFAVQWMAP